MLNNLWDRQLESRDDIPLSVRSVIRVAAEVMIGKRSQKDMDRIFAQMLSHSYTDKDVKLFEWLRDEYYSLDSRDRNEFLVEAMVPIMNIFYGIIIEDNEYETMVPYKIRQPLMSLTHALDRAGKVDYDVMINIIKNRKLSFMEAVEAEELFDCKEIPKRMTPEADLKDPYTEEKLLPWYFRTFCQDRIPEDIPGKISGYGRSRYLSFKGKTSWESLLREYIIYPELGSKPYSELRYLAKRIGLEELDKSKDMSFTNLYIYCLLIIGSCVGEDRIEKLRAFVFGEFDQIISSLIDQGSVEKTLLLLRLVPDLEEDGDRGMKCLVMRRCLEVFLLAARIAGEDRSIDNEMRETVLCWDLLKNGLDDPETLNGFARYLDLYSGDVCSRFLSLGDCLHSIMEDSELKDGLRRKLLDKARTILRGKDAGRLPELASQLRILWRLKFLDTSDAEERAFITKVTDWALELVESCRQGQGPMEDGMILALESILGMIRPTEEIIDSRLHLLELLKDSDLKLETIEMAWRIGMDLKWAEIYMLGIPERCKASLDILFVYLIKRVRELEHSPRNAYLLNVLLVDGIKVLDVDLREDAVLEDLTRWNSEYDEELTLDHEERMLAKVNRDVLWGYKGPEVYSFKGVELDPNDHEGLVIDPRPYNAPADALGLLADRAEDRSEEEPSEFLFPDDGPFGFDFNFMAMRDELLEKSRHCIIKDLRESLRYVTLRRPGLEMSLLKEVRSEQ